jgi:hypothetical protein
VWILIEDKETDKDRLGNGQVKKMTDAKKKILSKIMGSYSCPISWNDVISYKKSQGKGNIEIEDGAD